MIAVHTSELTKVYPGDITAVDRLSLDVEEGEIFGLLGPNGAGKSTTAGILTGRVLPTSGEATVAGIDVNTQIDLVKQVIGVVPQTNTLDRALTVRENLYHHGRYFGMSRKASREAADRELERFRLADRADAPVFALSGGLAQRLMLARAVMHGPSILFLDEPTSGLDPQSRLALWDILRELHAHGQTIVLTTHYMEEADQLCGRVAIIDRGRLLALDTPEALKATHGTGTVVTVNAEGTVEPFVAAVKDIPGVEEVTVGPIATAAAPSGPPNPWAAAAAKGKGGKPGGPPGARPGGPPGAGGPGADPLAGPGPKAVRIRLGGRQGMVAAIVNAAEHHGVEISDVAIATASLETVFIKLTGRALRE